MGREAQTALRSPGELDENETQGVIYEALELPLSVGIVESPGIFFFLINIELELSRVSCEWTSVKLEFRCRPELLADDRLPLSSSADPFLIQFFPYLR